MRAAAWTAGWSEGLGLIWPAECAGCGRPDVPLCTGCRGVLAGPAFHHLVPCWPAGWGGWAMTGYRGVPARLLLAWKERGRHDLSRPLGAGLGAAVLACRAASCGPALPWLLVPVPSTAAARRRRGTDPVRDLARHAALTCGSHWPGPPPRVLSALRHTRRVRDQSALDAAQRRANLDRAMAVRPAARALVAGQRCVVVDDIVTTGATAAEAARALAGAGALVVGICSLSATLRHGGVSGRANQG